MGLAAVTVRKPRRAGAAAATPARGDTRTLGEAEIRAIPEATVSEPGNHAASRQPPNASAA